MQYLDRDLAMVLEILCEVHRSPACSQVRGQYIMKRRPAAITLRQMTVVILARISPPMPLAEHGASAGR